MRSTLTLTILFSTALGGCVSAVPGSGGRDTDAGTQIGGIDCDYDKLEVRVQDVSGAAIESQIRTDFPDGDVLETACAASGCQLELAGAGTYRLHVSAGPLSAVEDVILDEDDVVGTTSEDCGGLPVHEDAVTIVVREDDGGGDILTSNLGVYAWDSAGQQVSGTVTVTDASGAPAWSRTCRPSRCWVDISGPGVHQLDFLGDNGESGAVSVTIDATDIIGVNELGDDVYERDVRIDLAP